MHVSQTANTVGKVRLYGKLNSRAAYDIRDFLQRSVVSFDWIEVQDDEDWRQSLALPAGQDLHLPIVVLPDGRVLSAPSLKELADTLGWVTEPRLREYDLSIYGAGPAGLSAAVYAASEGLKVIVVERHAVGGQAGSSSLIENYLGFPSGISGGELAERARQQAVKFGAEILVLSEGIKAEFHDGKIVVNLAAGGTMVARANICATGVEYRRLDLPRENEFLGRGLYYGAGAGEAPLCEGQVVYVVGGANSAGQAAMHFANYARKVIMLVRGASFTDTMSNYLATRILANPQIEVRFGEKVVGLDGDSTLRQIQVSDLRNQTVRTEDTNRLFVCIGGKPNTEWAKDTDIMRDGAGYLITGPDLLEAGNRPECWKLHRNPYYLETSVPGSFAAGDVRHGSTKRAAAAAGEGAMAITFVHRYLRESHNLV